MTLDYVDSLYDARQDRRLTNNALLILLRRGEISQWTYERLLALKPDGSSDWSKSDPDENDEDGSEFEGEDDKE